MKRKKKLPPTKQMIETVISSLFETFQTADENNNHLLMLKVSPELQSWIKLHIEHNKEEKEDNFDKAKEEWISKLTANSN